MRETLQIAELEPQPKRTPRKYDRRSITSAENGRRAWGMNLDAQVAELEQRIRELADSTSDERLRFEALRYLRDCRAGKPFTALNPVERKNARTDNRVQIAAQMLVLGHQPIISEELEIAVPEPQLLEPKHSEADQQADKIAELRARSRAHR
jgi:hypothetical protein